MSEFKTNAPKWAASQSGLRQQNERLVMSLVRRHGALAKSEIARMTGLSAQTVSVIMRELEADKLLMRCEPKRGQVGQPSIPHSLNPDGAYFLGAKIGRRSLDVLLIDFLGEIRHQESEYYPFPRPDEAVASIVATVRKFEAALGARASRIAGLGIAIPFELWNWVEQSGAPEAAVAAWRVADVRAMLSLSLPYPVYLQNDATSACGAELVFGDNAELQDFIYIYIGSFVGGGVVLNGGLYAGRSGNAGALGPMPVRAPAGGIEPLLNQASLVALEQSLLEAGIPTERLYHEDHWSGLGELLDQWLQTAARGLAQAIVSAASIIDFEAAVIDGSFPARVRADLIARVATEIKRIDTTGLKSPELKAGSLGGVARALGGATLPLFDRYLIAQHLAASRWVQM
ncbi:ROK family transcriptional regulator [Roseinatronobacter monicus]|uniref:MarR family transcriptional regulator n=1 Tax=Roseinatronobacter monicus TaxID=393481 RepID=A0A543K3M3_9RHOB|nr:ROK family transcriptional regulator [Roseinatronobacter monicus]TQM89669.1 MarR family transcriptional regulator [Roseinatronobacter monicus]